MKNEFVGLRAKTYSYLKENNDKDKDKRHKKVCHKKPLKFQECKNCLESTQIENKINHFEKK